MVPVLLAAEEILRCNHCLIFFFFQTSDPLNPLYGSNSRTFSIFHTRALQAGVLEEHRFCNGGKKLEKINFLQP